MASGDQTGATRARAIHGRAHAGKARSATQPEDADFAAKLTQEPGKLEAADLQKLREVGLTDAKIFYVIEIAALYNFTNRVFAACGLRPDDEFMAATAPMQ